MCFQIITSPAFSIFSMAPNLFFIIGSILLLSICQYRVVESLDHDNSDEKELKTKLLSLLKKKPNPVEKDCDDFMRVIREHEAITQSRGYKEEGRKVKLLKKDEKKKTDLERPP